MSESRPDQDFKPNTPLNEESIREGLNFSKECRPVSQGERESCHEFILPGQFRRRNLNL